MCYEQKSFFICSDDEQPMLICVDEPADLEPPNSFSSCKNHFGLQLYIIFLFLLIDFCTVYTM